MITSYMYVASSFDATHSLHVFVSVLGSLSHSVRLRRVAVRSSIIRVPHYRSSRHDGWIFQSDSKLASAAELTSQCNNLAKLSLVGMETADACAQ